MKTCLSHSSCHKLFKRLHPPNPPSSLQSSQLKVKSAIAEIITFQALMHDHNFSRKDTLCKFHLIIVLGGPSAYTRQQNEQKPSADFSSFFIYQKDCVRISHSVNGDVSRISTTPWRVNISALLSSKWAAASQSTRFISSLEQLLLTAECISYEQSTPNVLLLAPRLNTSFPATWHLSNGRSRTLSFERDCGFSLYKS